MSPRLQGPWRDDVQRPCHGPTVLPVDHDADVGRGALACLASPSRSPLAGTADPPNATRATNCTSFTDDRVRPSIMEFASLSTTVVGSWSALTRTAAMGGPGMPGSRALTNSGVPGLELAGQRRIDRDSDADRAAGGLDRARGPGRGGGATHSTAHATHAPAAGRRPPAPVRRARRAGRMRIWRICSGGFCSRSRVNRRLGSLRVAGTRRQHSRIPERLLVRPVGGQGSVEDLFSPCACASGFSDNHHRLGEVELDPWVVAAGQRTGLLGRQTTAWS